jgi:hypothetical protein
MEAAVWPKSCHPSEPVGQRTRDDGGAVGVVAREGEQPAAV